MSSVFSLTDSEAPLHLFDMPLTGLEETCKAGAGSYTHDKEKERERGAVGWSKRQKAMLLLQKALGKHNCLKLQGRGNILSGVCMCAYVYMCTCPCVNTHVCPCVHLCDSLCDCAMHMSVSVCPQHNSAVYLTGHEAESLEDSEPKTPDSIRASADPKIHLKFLHGDIQDLFGCFDLGSSTMECKDGL